MPEIPIILYTESSGQDLNDQLKDGSGRPLDSANIASVSFFMRPADSSVLKIDDAAATVSDNGYVLYSFSLADLDTAGEYRGWWRTTFINDDIVDSDEFLIIIREHAPGIRTRTGAIYERARSEIPMTWDALAQSDKYGDKLLQDKIDLVKLRVLGVEVAPENESTLDIRVQDYLGKLAALQVIPAGWDYWKEQHESITTGGGGTTEIASYPDRIAALNRAYERLLIQVKELAGEIEVILGTGTQLPSGAVPEASDGIDEGFVTPLPVANFRHYGFRDSRRSAYRGNWLPWDTI